KATSGLLVFGKTATANQALARQFEDRSVAKRYELLVAHDTDRPAAMHCDRPIGPDRLEASTDFDRGAAGTTVDRYDALPHTGRTHQVRVHAAALGMPILGDADYKGAPAPRLFLHAAGLSLDHPVSGPLDLA